jgi:hypothetical protein
MAYIIVPSTRKFSGQNSISVGINRIFSKNLVYCMVPKYGDLTRKCEFRLQGLGNYKPGILGPELDLQTVAYNGNGLVFTKSPYVNSAKYTLLTVFARYISNPYSSANLLEFGIGGSGAGFGIVQGTNIVRYTGGYATASTFAVPTTKPSTILCRAGPKIQFISDFQEDAEITDPGHYGIYGNLAGIGGADGYGTLTAGMSLQAFWDRQLSIEESRILVKNPWKLLTVSDKNIYFDAELATANMDPKKLLTLSNSGAPVDPTLLGTGTPAADKFLRGDGTWQTL